MIKRTTNTEFVLSVELQKWKQLMIRKKKWDICSQNRDIVSKRRETDGTATRRLNKSKTQKD